jgi:hypothetical protein
LTAVKNRRFLFLQLGRAPAFGAGDGSRSKLIVKIDE